MAPPKILPVRNGNLFSLLFQVGEGRNFFFLPCVSVSKLGSCHDVTFLPFYLAMPGAASNSERAAPTEWAVKRFQLTLYYQMLKLYIAEDMFNT